jgi:predicted ribosome quality control (RQC) complex YloA/Tae2 family protein
MALDGTLLYGLKNELENLLIDGKVDKIHQPEKDEIHLLIRNQKINYRLLLSAHSNYPRIHLTTMQKTNPKKAPSFCMLLRKTLQNGRIRSIEQPFFDRVIKITIDSYDELNILQPKELIVEMMGKHSNILLVDGESGKIIDSIKRVGMEVSSLRQVLPGLSYEHPPLDKTSPFGIDSLARFKETLTRSPKDSLIKGIFGNIIGFSPLISRELIERAGLDEDLSVRVVTDEGYYGLYQEYKKLLEALKSHTVSPAVYVDNDKPKAFSIYPLTHLSIYQRKDFDRISQVLEFYYYTKDHKERLKQKSQDLRKTVNLKLQRLVNKYGKLEKDYKNAENAEEHKLKGDLVTANLHRMTKGDREIEVQNFYDPQLKTVKIPLNIRMSPSENAQKFYKKYNKAKIALIQIRKQQLQTRKEIEYLQGILSSIDHAQDLSDIEEIREELEEEKIVKAKKKSKNKKPSPAKPLAFETSQGLTVLVGKNNKQNDKITFKISGKEDLWFHVKDQPGSHTVMLLEGKEPSDQSILEAATLAAFYSKGQNATKVSVDYTQRKHVKSPKGAKPGMVIYDNFSTILVDALEENIKSIKKVVHP